MNSPPRIYIAHAYAGDPFGNRARIRKICHLLLRQGLLPIAPQLWLYQIFNEDTQREEIMRMCLGYLETSDMVYQYTSTVGGVKDEVERAQELRIPVMYMGLYV